MGGEKKYGVWKVVSPEIQKALYAAASIDDSEDPPVSKELKKRYAERRKSIVHNQEITNG